MMLAKSVEMMITIVSSLAAGQLQQGPGEEYTGFTQLGYTYDLQWNKQ